MIMSEFLRDAIQELNDVNGAVAVCVRLEKNKGMMVRACISPKYSLLINV